MITHGTSVGITVTSVVDVIGSALFEKPNLQHVSLIGSFMCDFLVMSLAGLKKEIVKCELLKHGFSLLFYI